MSRVSLGPGASHGGVAESAGGPYRVSHPGVGGVGEMACTYCGNKCPTTLRVCPHCDVRFDNVRCVRCYTLQPPGAFACARCGQALELEPLLDATDAPCPRCKAPLEAAGGAGAWEGARIHECPRCGGMFVPREVLADILCRAEVAGPFPDVRPGRIPPLAQVTYIPCPMCHASMNRVNFGKMSGVIVDVCRTHGTWFDDGELTRVVAFAASGGLEKARAREAEERKERARRPPPVQLVVTPRYGFDVNERLEDWQTFLDALLW
ncbi:MAG TPA: zf-TFIIB domain-containing protein [Labilithrix sp.]|nr:zf-TFIIB domain-containing protein [Labilithrix sp.]